MCRPGSWARSPLRTGSLHTRQLVVQYKHAGGLASDHQRRAGVKVHQLAARQVRRPLLGVDNVFARWQQR